MKTYIPSTLFIATILAATALAADPKPDEVTVSFHEAEEFTDARSHWGGDTEQHYLDTLADHLRKNAPAHLPPGYKLEVTFTDIDLAGDFIPASAQAHDVRIIKDIYIPRQRLTFRLLDAEGTVVKEGERRLTDLNFMNNAGIVGRNEPLFYDKALLTDWLRKEFKS